MRQGGGRYPEYQGDLVVLGSKSNEMHKKKKRKKKRSRRDQRRGGDSVKPDKADIARFFWACREAESHVAATVISCDLPLLGLLVSSSFLPIACSFLLSSYVVYACGLPTAPCRQEVRPCD